MSGNCGKIRVTYGPTCEMPGDQSHNCSAERDNATVLLAASVRGTVELCVHRLGLRVSALMKLLIAVQAYVNYVNLAFNYVIWHYVLTSVLNATLPPRKQLGVHKG